LKDSLAFLRWFWRCCCSLANVQAFFLQPNFALLNLARFILLIFSCHTIVNLWLLSLLSWRCFAALSLCWSNLAFQNWGNCGSLLQNAMRLR
jgi:hypothetical protein